MNAPLDLALAAGEPQAIALHADQLAAAEHPANLVREHGALFFGQSERTRQGDLIGRTVIRMLEVREEAITEGHAQSMASGSVNRQGKNTGGDGTVKTKESRKRCAADVVAER